MCLLEPAVWGVVEVLDYALWSRLLVRLRCAGAAGAASKRCFSSGVCVCVCAGAGVLELVCWSRCKVVCAQCRRERCCRLAECCVQGVAGAGAVLLPKAQRVVCISITSVLLQGVHFGIGLLVSLLGVALRCLWQCGR